MLDLSAEVPIEMLTLEPEEQLQRRLVARYLLQGMPKTAAFPPFAKEGPPIPPGGAPSKRNIPTEHNYNPSALKPLSRMLWAMSVSLGHALTAYRQFTKLKSATISPDGMLGGRGYIMPVKEVRQKLYEACESLSAISDTLHDEINGPHWKPKLAQLDPNDAEDVQRFIEESQQILANPEEDAEEEMEAIEQENDGAEESEASDLPGAGDSQSEAAPLGQTKEASYSYFRGNSSLPVDSLSGPRVNHLGPAEGQGPLGGYNWEDPPVEDAWGLSDGRNPTNEYDYSSEWENDTREAGARHAPKVEEIEEWWGFLDPGSQRSIVREIHMTAPDSRRWNAADWEKVMDYYVQTELGDPRGYDRGRNIAHSTLPEDLDTHTEAWDFGIGYGARGEGAGGYENPSGEGDGDKGVLGPTSGLPVHSQGLLPTDVADPVARSDYYTEGLNDHTVSQSELPAEHAIPVTYDRDLPNTSEMYEHHDTPYIRYDYTTPNYRPDPNYSRPYDKAFSQ